MPVAQQRAKIVFVDQVTGDDLKTVTQSGQSDTVIPYLSEDDLATFANEHYVLVKNGYDPAGNAPNFDSNDAVDQIYYITLKHGTQPTTRQSDVTETIHYVYSNGKPAHDDVVVTKHFTQNGTKDLVTGQTEWQPVDSQQFTSVMSPEIVGYQADKKFIPAITVNFGDGNVTRTVTYSKVVQPTKPTSPTQPTAQPTKPTSPTQPTAQPTKPTSPTQPTNQPTKPTSPTQPTAQPTKPSGQQPTGSSVPTPRPVPAGRPTIPTAAPEPVPVVQPVAKVVTAQPVSLHQGQPTPRAAQRNNTTLPQTGNAEVVSAAALGLMGLALAGGFAATKKRHE